MIILRYIYVFQSIEIMLAKTLLKFMTDVYAFSLDRLAV